MRKHSTTYGSILENLELRYFFSAAPVVATAMMATPMPNVTADQSAAAPDPSAQDPGGNVAVDPGLSADPSATPVDPGAAGADPSGGTAVAGADGTLQWDAIAANWVWDDNTQSWAWQDKAGAWIWVGADGSTYSTADPNTNPDAYANGINSALPDGGVIAVGQPADGMRGPIFFALGAVQDKAAVAPAPAASAAGEVKAVLQTNTNVGSPAPPVAVPVSQSQANDATSAQPQAASVLQKQDQTVLVLGDDKGLLD